MAGIFMYYSRNLLSMGSAAFASIAVVNKAAEYYGYFGILIGHNASGDLMGLDRVGGARVQVRVADSHP